MGDDETVALTAFVVIALQHGLAIFQDDAAEQLKQKVVSVPGCLPFPDPQLPPSPPYPCFLPRKLGVQLPDLPPHFVLGNLHLKSKLVLGGEGKCWDPGCSCSCHHSLCPDSQQGS